jgi:DNA polymerase IV
MMDAKHSAFSQKVDFFEQFESSVSGNDDLALSELAQRRKSRCFFESKPEARSERDAPKHAAEDGSMLRPLSVATPEPEVVDHSEEVEIIKATPTQRVEPTQGDNRGRRRSKNGPSQRRPEPVPTTDSDTVIPDSTKSAGKTLRPSDPAPALPPMKRRLRNTRGATAPAPSTRGPAATKRRKTGPAKVRPEHEQIFRGLEFFYIPDNDIAPTRRQRIAKAVEYGATRTGAVDRATHVVVDRSISYKDIEKIISKGRKGAERFVLVNEDYPVDCIQFKAILDPTQAKYLLAGQPPPVATDASEEEVSGKPAHPTTPKPEGLNRSLQLKPPHKNRSKWDYVPLEESPQRREDSPASQASHVSGTPIPMDSQPIELDMGFSRDEQAEPCADDNVSDSIVVTVDDPDSPVDEPTSRTKPSSTHKDELSDYIALMQEYKDVPLDVDEEEETNDSEGSGRESGSDGEVSSRKKPARSDRKPNRKGIRFEDRFACNNAGVKDAKGGNPNSRTIEILEKMASYYDRTNDQWRTIAYRKVISTLKRQTVKITTEEEAFRLPSIGRRLAQKIEEIVTTDRLQRLEYAEAEPLDEALQLFLQIYGVGSSQAQQWIAQGFRTLEDLKEKAKLTPNQLLGIEHYDDLNTKIPRSEVEALGVVVKKTAATIDRDVELIIGGSYRRGSDKSGDIDFIVTKPGTESSLELRPFLDRLVQRLEESKFLVARLASSRTGSDGSKWHGCCVLPEGARGADMGEHRSIWRRIDFLVVPASELGAALLYFTGNDIFNRSMRLLASKKGMRLNQRGLYKDVMRGPGRAKVTEGELVEGMDEKRIFEVLGVKWREPHERWC